LARNPENLSAVGIDQKQLAWPIFMQRLQWVAEPIFRYEWERCSLEEKLVLYHVAHGNYPNPLANRTVENLLARRLLTLNPTPGIPSEAFKRFIQHAEPAYRINAWLEDESGHGWQTMRWTFAIIILLLLGWLFYSAGNVFETLSYVVGAVATFVTAIVKTLSAVKSVKDV